MNKLNAELNTSGSLTSLVTSKTFVNLDQDLQNKIIESVAKENTKKGGLMGKFLGTDSANASMHISLILCGLLILLLAIDFFHAYHVQKNINMDLVSTIIPVITLSLGYIFGKGS